MNTRKELIEILKVFELGLKKGALDIRSELLTDGLSHYSNVIIPILHGVKAGNKPWAGP